MKIDIKNILKIVLSFYFNKEILTNDEIEIIENFIESNYKFHIVKLNDESIEFFNLKFLYFKNNHNLKYDKYSIFFKQYKNYFENFIVEYFVYSIVLNDEINTYIIFNDEINVMFKKILSDLLKLDYKTLLNKNLNLTNKDMELLKEIENKKYYYISNDEKIENYKKSIKFNENKIDELIERKNEIEIKIKNNLKHNEVLLNKLSISDERNIKLSEKYFNENISTIERNKIERKLNNTQKNIERLLKLFNESVERLENRKKSIEYFENSINYYQNSIEYYQNLIEKIEIEIDEFQGTNTFFESISYFENYENFEYSYKERKLLNLF